MDFTREPIIETVITPKEGCKIVVRSSKNIGQEEFFVDAVEVVSFGSALFFRSKERPKPFLVPVSDYEILEVREARMVLKAATLDRSIKIAGGKEASVKSTKEVEKGEVKEDETAEKETTQVSERGDKKRDRRRQYRRKRSREELTKEELPSTEEIQEGISETREELEKKGEGIIGYAPLLPPPPTLIRETIKKYRDSDLFKNVFFTKEEQELREQEEQEAQEETETYISHEKMQELLEEEDEMTESFTYERPKRLPILEEEAEEPVIPLGDPLTPLEADEEPEAYLEQEKEEDHANHGNELEEK